MTGSFEWNGSLSRSAPSDPITSISARSAVSTPQSKWPSTPEGKASVPVKRTSTPSPPITCWPVTASGSPATSRAALTQ